MSKPDEIKNGTRWRHRRTKRIAVVHRVTVDRVEYKYEEPTDGSKYVMTPIIGRSNFTRYFEPVK